MAGWMKGSWLTGIGSSYCSGTTETSGSWRINDLLVKLGLYVWSDKASGGSMVNWICSSIPQWLTGHSSSDRRRKRECMHACRPKDNKVAHSSHSPLAFFSWCVLREVLLQIQRVLFVFDWFNSAAVQNLLPGSQLTKCHPQTAAMQWAGYSYHHYKSVSSSTSEIQLSGACSI